jgi:hypothetical protein
MNKSIWLLVISILTLIVSAIFSFTPAAWYLTGRQPETYPELLFAFYHLPTAFLLVADSVLIIWFARIQTKSGTTLLWISALSKLAVLTMLSLEMCFLPEPYKFDVLGQILLNIYHPIILPLQIIASIIGTIRALRSKRPYNNEALR